MTPKLGDVTLELRLLAKCSPSQIPPLTTSLLFTHWRAGRMLGVLFVFLPGNPDHVLTRLLDFYIKMLLFALSFHHGSPGTRNCCTKLHLPPLPVETKKWCRCHSYPWFQPSRGLSHHSWGLSAGTEAFQNESWGKDQTKLTVPHETMRGGNGDHPPRALMAANRTNSLGFFWMHLIWH